MIPCRIARFIHTNSLIWQESSKSLLAKLRKNTGYTIGNCRKALELHQNDVEKAEAWLKEQAQQHGWEQAKKLQNRATSQGVVALMIDRNRGALVEVNCETDFVARNAQFQELAKTVVTAVLKHTSTLESSANIKNMLCGNSLTSLLAEDGVSLGDHMALTVGTIRENVKLRRALCANVPSDIYLCGCTHPNQVHSNNISIGKYGALITLKCPTEPDELGVALCQHVIGMKPQKIGNPAEDAPLSAVENEPCMIYQEFLHDQSLSVQQLLSDAQTEILDFARFETGEVLENDNIVESIETCG